MATPELVRVTLTRVIGSELGLGIRSRVRVRVSVSVRVW